MCFPSAPDPPQKSPEELALIGKEGEALDIQNQILREQLEETKRTREMLELYGPQDAAAQEQIRELSRLEIELSRKQYDLATRQFEAAEAARPAEEEYRATQLSISQEQMEMMRQQMQWAEEMRPEEQEYRQTQLEMAQKAQEQMEEYLKPKEKTPEELMLEELGMMQGERLKKAYAGELPIDEGTRQRKEEDRRQLEEEMSRRLGPNWRESTPGIQSLKAFEEKWGSLEDAMRRGEIDSGTAIMLSGLGMMSDMKAQDPRFQQLATIQSGQSPALYPQMQPTYAGTPQIGSVMDSMYGRTASTGLYGFPEMMGGYGSLQQGYGNVLNRMGGERMAIYDYQTSAAMQKGANQAALYGSMFSAGGIGAGLAI